MYVYIHTLGIARMLLHLLDLPVRSLLARTGGWYKKGNKQCPALFVIRLPLLI